METKKHILTIRGYCPQCKGNTLQIKINNPLSCWAKYSLCKTCSQLF